MSPRTLRVTTVVAGALLFAAAPLAAQGTTQAPDTIRIERPTVVIPAGALPPAPVHHNLVSFQPLNAIFESYQVEYERTLSPTATVGLGGNLWNHIGSHYRSADLKLRYYPGARALQGFSFGVSAGYSNITVDDSGDKLAHGPTAGALFEYNWLLGGKQNFHVGMGLGAKTLFGRKDDFAGDINWHYPTARLSIGWAF